MDRDDVTDVVHDPVASRFRLADHPDAGYLEYERSGDRIVLKHTEVAEHLEGQGVGGALVRTALEHAEQAQLTIEVRCPFVASWLERHPERAVELDIASG